MEVRKIAKKTVSVIEPKQSLLVDKAKYQQTRMAAYCRVSTDSAEQKTSYETQKQVYTDMIAKRKDWEMVGIYADEGISGTRADKRPEFNRMIKDCLSGKIDYIITKSVSRFARNTVECLEYVRMLKARNIGILFEEQNIDTLKCDSELYLVIYAGFAQSESESMSKNITWAFRKNFEDGKVVFNYSKMVGYRKGNDGNPEIIPEEAEVIRNIFDWFLAGRTPREIVDLLIADGIQTKCGKQKWSVGTIQSILRNEKYCGDAILQKTVTIDCISKTHKKNTGEAPMYYVHNNHEAIITREQFNKAQEELLRRNTIAPKMSSRTISAQGRYSRYALTEILHCDECGSRYKRCTWAKRGVKKVMWRCVSRIEHGTQYCKHSPSIEESALHSAIVRAINRFNQENETTYRLLMRASLSDALGIGGSNEEMELLTRRIDSLNAKMMKLINDAVSEGRSIDDNEGEFKEISDEIAQLNRRVSAIKELIANDESAKDRLESINAKVEQLKDGITEYDDTIVRQMIECIKVYGDKRIEVIFGGGTSIIEEL